MATVSAVPKEVLISKRVQEMASTWGEEIPASFRGRASADDFGDLSKEKLPLPLIDLSRLSPSAKGSKPYEEEMKKLKQGLFHWGAFQAIHGLPRSLLDALRQVTRGFFELPMEEKQKCSKPLDQSQGYGADPAPADGVVLDWSDRLLVEVLPEEERQYKYWPDKPANLKEVMDELGRELMKVTKVTNVLFARALDLEDTCFQRQLGEREKLNVSLNYYPCCKRPDLVFGIKPHTDYSAYTMIVGDREGVQMSKDGKWFTVPYNPDSVLIVVGDQMEIMTNGVLKASFHRVLINAEKDRVSLNLFYLPEKGRQIGPEPALVKDPKNKYKVVKDYYEQIYWKNYTQGNTKLDSAYL